MQPAVAEYQPPVGVLGDVLLVGDHDDGAAVVVQSVEQLEDLAVATRSRLPVGSSTSSTSGSPTSARAMATRCIWPPRADRGRGRRGPRGRPRRAPHAPAAGARRGARRGRRAAWPRSRARSCAAAGCGAGRRTRAAGCAAGPCRCRRGPRRPGRRARRCRRRLCRGVRAR